MVVKGAFKRLFGWRQYPPGWWLPREILVNPTKMEEAPWQMGGRGWREGGGRLRREQPGFRMARRVASLRARPSP